MKRATKRIALITDTLKVGGAERHSVVLANGLAQCGIEVTLITLRPPYTQSELISEMVDSVLLDIPKGISIEGVLAVRRTLSAKGFDSIVCSNGYALLIGYFASAFLWSKPNLIEIFHTTVILDKKELRNQRVYNLIFNVARHVVFVSSNQKEYWQSRGVAQRNGVAIINGTDTGHFSRSVDLMERGIKQRLQSFKRPEYLTLVVCAALRPEKAHLDLLCAQSALRAEGLHVNLLIVGDGPTRSEIDSLCRELGLADQICFTGAQSDVRHFILAADAFILPSIAVETMSIAAIEAMSLCMPLLMSRIGGATELVEDGVNGYLFEPGNVHGIAAAVKQLASNAGNLPAMGDISRQRAVKYFDVTRMIEEYHRILVTL